MTRELVAWMLMTSFVWVVCGALAVQLLFTPTTLRPIVAYWRRHAQNSATTTPRQRRTILFAMQIVVFCTWFVWLPLAGLRFVRRR